MSTCRPRRLVATAIIASATMLTNCGPPLVTPPPFEEDTPRLMLFLVIDQFSQEYLVRMRQVLSGGFGYLLDNGVVFTNAHQNHANTVTGAGHATLATGSYPRRSGIIGNGWYDRETGEEIYSVEDEQHHRSPSNLLVTTIGDWLKDMDPHSKIFAASGKDRSAILTGGHQADGAFWDSDGNWETSSYYSQPDWLDVFNDRKWLDQFFGKLWEPLPVEDDVLKELSIVTLDEGIYQRSFPYAFGSKSLLPNSDFYDALKSSPFSDMYLAELAKTIIVEEELGTDEHPDFLGLAFSAVDSVGHDFGPHSREVLDTILRLDQTLADLLKFVDQLIGLDNVVISLSSDHGVVPIPAYRESVGNWGEQADMDDIACFQTAGRVLNERYGDTDWLKVGRYLNDEMIEAAGIGRSKIEGEIAALLATCDSVEHVWTRGELLATEPTSAAEQPAEGEAYFRQLFFNSYHSERSPDFSLQYAPYYLDSMGRGSSHGTPYKYDTWVPFIVIAPGFGSQQISDRVHTADMAPTLASIMGIETPTNLDGVDLSASPGTMRSSRERNP